MRDSFWGATARPRAGCGWVSAILTLGDWKPHWICGGTASSDREMAFGAPQTPRVVFVYSHGGLVTGLSKEGGDIRSQAEHNVWHSTISDSRGGRRITVCKQLFVRSSRVSRFPSVVPTSHLLWLVVFAVIWTLAGTGGMAFGQVAGVDDPSDMADSSGDIKGIEAWVEDGNLNLTMTVYGVFAPSVEETPAGMSNRYYYHWILDTDNDPATGFSNSEYEDNPTNLEPPSAPIW